MIYLRYGNLNELIYHSSSSRNYFLSLPPEIQIKLHEHENYIHTAADLRLKADMTIAYSHAAELSDSLDKLFW